MSRYALYGSGHANNSHRLLLGPPLVAVLVFCFGFAWLQQHDASSARQASANKQASFAHQTVPIPLASSDSATQSTINQTAAPQPTAAPVSAPSDSPADNSQPASSTAASDIQAATTHQSSTQNTNLKVGSDRLQSLPLSLPSGSNLFKLLLSGDR